MPDALELSYRYLNRRDRTAGEVRKHLVGKGIEPDAVEDAIETLRDQGYVDDARYARLLAEDKRALEGWGSERIKNTLASRGIDRHLIEAAVAGDGDGDAGSEMERALEILRRRFPSPPQERRDRERALAVLLRKGYDSELALDALAAHARAG